jgi:uncharacterized protein with PIN domain
MPTAHFTFHGTLNYFLQRHQRNQTIHYEFDWKASLKDMLEAQGPPHPEVELVTVNGVSVGWETIVQPDDDIHAYDDYDGVDLAEKVRLIPPYPIRPKFILDTHLGKLANYLRMMGFDTLYRNDYDDDELAQVSHDETRIVLSRDFGVLKRGIVTYGYFVRNTDPTKQLVEISQRYGLAQQLEPFSYCMRCNGRVVTVSKQDVINHLPEDTAAYYEEFQQCQSCQQVYWKGSHHEKMERLLNLVINGS